MWVSLSQELSWFESTLRPLISGLKQRRQAFRAAFHSTGLQASEETRTNMKPSWLLLRLRLAIYHAVLACCSFKTALAKLYEAPRARGS